jgi:hypothetical protein
MVVLVFWWFVRKNRNDLPPGKSSASNSSFSDLEIIHNLGKIERHSHRNLTLRHPFDPEQAKEGQAL